MAEVVGSAHFKPIGTHTVPAWDMHLESNDASNKSDDVALVSQKFSMDAVMGPPLT